VKYVLPIFMKIALLR